MKRSLDLIQTIEQPCIDDVQHYVTATIVKMLLKESILFYIFFKDSYCAFVLISLPNERCVRLGSPSTLVN